MILADYCEREMSEALKVKYVVRNGKRKKKYITTRHDRYKVEYDANGRPHEVRITATERRKRRIGQKKGKLKRKAKVGLIELRRRRSFIARRNTGLSYNKKLPDLVMSRGPGGHVAASGPKTLRPEIKEQFLNEAPHSYLFTDDEDHDWVWDFYAEMFDDQRWLEDIIDIYTKHEIKSAVPGGQEDGDVLEIPPEYLDEITANLCSGIEFLMVASKDFVRAPEWLQDKFRDYVPAQLYMAMKPFIDKFQNSNTQT